MKLKHRRRWGWRIYDLNGWGIYGLNGWDIYDLNGCGIYDLNGWGHLWLKWMGRLVTVFGRYAPKKKSTGLQGSTLSGPHMTMMTTGFGPFELPTRGLLQKGRDHSPSKACVWEACSAVGVSVLKTLLLDT